MGLAPAVSRHDVGVKGDYLKGTGTGSAVNGRGGRGRLNLEMFRYTKEELARFERLVAQYGSTIYNIAYRLTGNREDAEDLKQDALVRVLRHIGKYEEGTAVESWLYRIVTNLHIDQARRRALRQVESLDELFPLQNGSSVSKQPTDGIDHTWEAYRMEEFRYDIRSALERLPKDLRRVLILSYVGGFSYEEISVRTDIPVGTVKSRLHRARELMARHLLEDDAFIEEFPRYNGRKKVYLQYSHGPQKKLWEARLDAVLPALNNAGFIDSKEYKRLTGNKNARISMRRLSELFPDLLSYAPQGTTHRSHLKLRAQIPLSRV